MKIHTTLQLTEEDKNLLLSVFAKRKSYLLGIRAGIEQGTKELGLRQPPPKAAKLREKVNSDIEGLNRVMIAVHEGGGPNE